jgi:dihydrofolate synthase/folylpolyglutamate synthase
MFTTYDDAIEWLYNLQWFGIKLGLEKISHLLGLLRNPQNDYKIIHVGGTNGKGSVCTMIGSILSEAGHKVGVNTSPHLVEFTERIVINGEQISNDEVLRLVNLIKPLVEKIDTETDLEHPTYFEVVTAMALKYFAEQEVEFVILEVGLGGTYDATNIVKPLISVITPVSLDHTDMLGDTLASVAQNKAGIIKENGILVTNNNDPEVMNVIEDTCQEKSCELFKIDTDIQHNIKNSDLNGSAFDFNGINKNYKNLKIPILGDHQVSNAVTAVAVIELLGKFDISVNENAVRQGLEKTVWPGRLEILQESPYLVIDCAHNPSAARVLKTSLQLFKFEKLILIIGMCEEKDVPGYVKELVPGADAVIVTRAEIHRAVKPEAIFEEAKKYVENVIIKPSVKSSIEHAKSDLATDRDLICVTGSIFIVAEANELWLDNQEKFRISY